MRQIFFAIFTALIFSFCVHAQDAQDSSAVMLNNSGEKEYSNGKYDKAMEYYYRSLSNSSASSNSMIVSHSGLGKAYEKLKNYPMAYYNYSAALKLEDSKSLREDLERVKKAANILTDDDLAVIYQDKTTKKPIDGILYNRVTIEEDKYDEIQAYNLKNGFRDGEYNIIELVELNGISNESGFYKNDKLSGERTIVTMNSYQTHFFKDGVLDGPFDEQFKNEYISGNYKNGKLEGIVTEEYFGKKMVSTYKNGKLEGQYLEYTIDDIDLYKLKYEYNYKDDKKNGLFKIYYDNFDYSDYGEKDVLQAEGTYKDNKLDGIVKVYNFYNQELAGTLIYSNGVLKSASCGDGEALTAEEIRYYKNFEEDMLNDFCSSGYFG